VVFQIHSEELDVLIQASKKVFIDELCLKIEEIDKMLIACGARCSTEDIRELLRFFHSMNGTAATLELDSLASIGRRWEIRLKEKINEHEFIEEDMIKKIHKEIYNIKDQIGCVYNEAATKTRVPLENSYINNQSRGRILLIDDDLTILKLLENAFTIEGYTIYICDDPVSAFELIAATKPDVIILDILMPEVNGYELLEKIKAKPEYADIHVIFLSAVDSSEDRIKGVKLGADDYITKPFIINEVIAKVEAALRRSNKYKDKLLRDEFTGAYSRHYFSYRFMEELERYKRNEKAFSIAFVDIDFLRLINEKYGYGAGDRVLKEFASYLNRNIRKCDILFRYGGEEFIVLLPDTDSSKALLVIDRIREGFAGKDIDAGDMVIRATFSAGIIQINDKDITEEELIKYAANTTYKAKSLGRNTVAIFEK